MDVTVEVKGLQELEARLLEIEGLGSKKILDRVFRKIAKPMMLAAKANASGLSKRGSSGALARSVAIVTTKQPAGNTVSRVLVTSKAKDRTALYLHNAFYNRKRKGIFYGWMVEKGHGMAVGNPWFWPAVHSTESQARVAFVEELRKAIDRIERRKAKQANVDSVVPA